VCSSDLRRKNTWSSTSSLYKLSNRKAMTSSRDIIDQKIMGEFFQKHLSVFDGVKKIVALKIYPHDPHMVISKKVTLAKYEFTYEDASGQKNTLILRGSSGPDNKRGKAYRLVKKLRASSFSSGQFVVPRPFGYFPELGLFLYENVKGQSLLQAFESGGDNYKELIQASIDWLIKYHDSNPRDIPDTEFDWKLDRGGFKMLIQNLEEKFSAQSERINKTVTLLEKREHEILDPENFRLVHGDYQPNNIIFSGQQTAVIDFNDAFLFDELFDLAYFLTQTHYMFRRIRGFAIPEFLEEMKTRYFEKRNLARNALAEKKLALFTAKTLLHIKILTSHELGAKILDEIEIYAQKTI
jgi:aminoglycoside phosphotransferase (APT) family kinase protein